MDSSAFVSDRGLRDEAWFQVVIGICVLYLLFEIAKTFYIFAYYLTKMSILVAILFATVFSAQPYKISTFFPETIREDLYRFFQASVAASYDMLPIETVVSKITSAFAWFHGDLL
jgi:hypothetical protein